ncbi:MAG: hypothetical protein GXC94_04180 [Comamonadaceae bacterium]|nr:hypothetical protein [Comamonadaceae bacterium]
MTSCAGVLLAGAALAQQPVEVALAGFAYAGSEQAIAARFPYSQQYVKALETAGAPIFQRLSQSLQAAPPEHLRIVDQIQDLKGRDQALAVALVIGSETVVVEQFGGLHKLLVLIRGQTMFFDFKSMNVVRAYPLSFAYVDALDHAPSADEIRARVKLVYEGVNDKPGLLSRFAASVSKAAIPAQVPRFLQVTAAHLAPEVLEGLPGYLKSEPGAAENWLADIVGEAISTRAGVPIVPFSKGYAVGNVMSMRVSDGTVWELKLPKPDFEIGVDMTGLKKIKFSEVPGGATSFVYGAYAQLRIEDSLKKGLNTALKNGETRVIPASQRYVDDFPHFYDAMNGLFTKLALVVDGRGDEKWIRGAAAAKDIDQQIAKTRELIRQCK